jgi:hypothetical protein
VGGIVDADGELVHRRAKGFEGVLDGGVEEFFLRGEVIVEGPDPDVGGLRDLQDRDVDSSGRDEALGGADE